MNVYDAANERMARIFKDFDNVYVSFSGGKDSGVLLNLAIEYARSIGRRIGVFHMDYEAQYQATTDYVKKTLAGNQDVIDVYHICLPLAAQCATSMNQSHWIPWDKDKKEIWVRPMPEGVINEDYNPLDFFTKGMWDYDLQERFGRWIHKKNKATRTASLIGIRTQESFHRWKALFAERTADTNYQGLNYSTKLYKDVYNFYPIFDWTSEDVWTANAKKGWEYNRLYDLFHKAGVPLGSMRVASPFNDYAKESLKLYRVIDPKNWGRMIGRVDGVNFTGIYGGTTAMGWKSIKLPPGHTWKSYMEFLLSTLPQSVADNYKKKLATSIKYWREKGGEVSDETIAEMEQQGVEFIEIGERDKRSGRKPIRLEYLDDCETGEFRLIPTYKRMVVCILKNDHTCKYMGFGPTKIEWALRKNAERKYANL